MYRIDEIIQDCREARGPQWDAFVSEFGHVVEQEARRYARSPEEAEEFAQDTWIKVLNKFDTFEKGEQEIRAWLRSVARNTALDAIRRSVRERTVEIDHAHLSARPEHEPERAAIAKCRLEEAVALISNMCESDRRIAAAVCSELDSDQIAGSIGCPKSRVYMRLHHFRRKIRALAL